MFIALLGVGPTGYQGRDHARRSRAVSAGDSLDAIETLAAALNAMDWTAT
jgi:hypothetical protein